MESKKTYKAFVGIKFEVLSHEKPIEIAKSMAEIFNLTRGDNLHCEATLIKLNEIPTAKGISRLSVKTT